MLGAATARDGSDPVIVANAHAGKGDVKGEADCFFGCVRLIVSVGLIRHNP
jgi:hypothetical protein